ncbi:hypothetical protein LWC35_20170 [Pseudonocardia kujensis]|uniref:hypothetical protein n=1 Tax=Pseudonocardia kujensis TaxID=1128675 RepID=UPI001E325E72|nr:hypothetical protein [Pseudonocardia kujensis]MCE0765198.1 hypothetical protein [Pseudonocardia kujensis]
MVRSLPGPVRHGSALALAAGGVVAVLGAAAPLSGSVGAALPTSTSPEARLAADTVPVPVIPAQRGAPAVEMTALADAARSAGEHATAEAERQQEQAAEAARASQAEERAKQALGGRTLQTGSGSTSCGMSTASLGAVKPWVTDAVEFLGCRFGEPRTLGVGSRGNASDHPSGLAADFMVGRASGDAIADCALQNMQALGVSYVIWQQRINDGSGWQAMEDRGSPTANHEDHVHVSFAKSAPSGRPVTC